jgi:hypothetical protein
VSNNRLNFEDMGVYQHIDDCHPAALEPCFLTDIILEEDMIM